MHYNVYDLSLNIHKNIASLFLGRKSNMILLRERVKLVASQLALALFIIWTKAVAIRRQIFCITA